MIHSKRWQIRWCSYGTFRCTADWGLIVITYDDDDDDDDDDDVVIGWQAMLPCEIPMLPMEDA